QRACAVLAVLLASSRVALANPHPDPSVVLIDIPGVGSAVEVRELLPEELRRLRGDAVEVLRVQVDWDPVQGTYRLGELVRERSGTEAFARRATREDALGSYKARLVDLATGLPIAHDSVGTGQEFRRLTRALTFRFPVPLGPVGFEMVAENPRSGV